MKRKKNTNSPKIKKKLVIQTPESQAFLDALQPRSKSPIAGPRHPNIVCIIPARGGSKRLTRKNLRSVLGKPMIQWAIEACQKSKYINNKNIFVSSEDSEILNVSKALGANTIQRPKELAEDDVWTQEVLKHSLGTIDAFLIESDISWSIDIIVRIQANSPQVTGRKIDECISKLVAHNLREVFTVNYSGIEDAAIHVMQADCVFQDALSVYKGIVITDYIDVHDEEDLRNVEELMKNRQLFPKLSNLDREMRMFLVGRGGDELRTNAWRISVPILTSYVKLLEKSDELYNLVTKKYDLKPGSKVLDLGCGFCPYWSFLQDAGFSEFVGVDLFSLRDVTGANDYKDSAEALIKRFCDYDTNFRLIEADVRDLGEHLNKKEKFDVIFTQSTDCTKKGNTGIPKEIFDEVCQNWLAPKGIAIYDG